MPRALNRHLARIRFAARAANWLARAGANARPPESLHFLKKTGRPCSCALCKAPRYVRSREQAPAE